MQGRTEIDSTAKPKWSAELEFNVNSDLCKVKQYFDINILSLIVQKWEIMQIGTHQSIVKMADVLIRINDAPLKHISLAKYLGMYVDLTLKWDDHINNMIPKISAKTGIRRSLHKIVPIDILRHIYNAIVQPHFNYGDVVNDSASMTSKTRLQKLQSRSARLIYGSSPRKNINAMFK